MIKALLATVVVARLIGHAHTGPTPSPTEAPQLVPKPPGEVLKSQDVWLAAAGAPSLYHAILSRVQLHPATGIRPPIYQPYLTIYAHSAASNTAEQWYQSPGASDAIGLVPKVTAVPGSPDVYFPLVDVKIVGAAHLMNAGGPNAPTQLVVSVHQAAADCGMTTIAVLSSAAPSAGSLTARGLAPVELIRAENPCDLQAALAGNALRLSGPYYAKAAPLCCPTKRSVSATLSYDLKLKTWSLSPAWFKLARPTP